MNIINKVTGQLAHITTYDPVTGEITGFAPVGNVALGPVSNVTITGGTAGQALVTDGNGNLQFADVAGSYDDANVSSYLDGNITTDIVPAGTEQSLGSLANPWKDLYLSGNTMYIAGVPLSVGSSSELVFNGVPLVTTTGTETIETTGNITGASITATGEITADGNITANAGYFFVGDGGFLSNVGGGGSYGNADVEILLGSGNVDSNIITTGNVLAGALYAGDANSVTPGTPFFTSNSQGTVFGLVDQAGIEVIAGAPLTLASDQGITIDALSNSNIILGGLTTNEVIVLSNIVSGNTITTSSNVIASHFIGNGSQLTGLPAGYSDANVETLLSSGTVTTNIITTANVTGAYIIGDGSELANITGANVTGVVANATFATTAGSADSVAGANVVGEVANATFATTSGSADSVAGANVVGEVANAAFATTSGSADSVAGANVTGVVANATFATTSGSADSVAGANVTGVVANATFATTSGSADSVAGANVVGEVANATFATTAGSADSVAGANVTGQVANALVAGTVYEAAQPTITSVGALTALTVSGDATVEGNTVTDDIIGRTSGVTITATGTDQNITLVPTGTGYVDVSGTAVKNLLDPVDVQDAATKAYVDSVAEGLTVQDACVATTAADLATITGDTVTYNNGTDGVGATLTLSTALTALDGVTLANGDRVLIKNETDQATNGIYTWATGGTVLTRATNYDTTSEIGGGDFVFITGGVVYGNSGWVQVDNIAAIGTDPIQFTQFSGAASYTAGTGLTLTGTQFSITNTAVTAGTYGNASTTVTVAVNPQGQITGVTQQAVVANAETLSGTTLNSTVVNSSLTSVGTLTDLAVTGNVTAGFLYGDGSNITGLPAAYSNADVANYLPTYAGNLDNIDTIIALTIKGEGGNIANIQGGNVQGTVANALHSQLSDVATVANSVAGANVTGVVANATFATTSGSADSVAGANVTGQVANSLVAGTVYEAAQPNITSVGTLTDLAVTGNVTAGFLYGDGSNITGLPAGYSNADVANYLPTYTGNLDNVSSVGNATTVLFGDGANITGLPAQYGNAEVSAYLASGADTAGFLTFGDIQTTTGNGSFGGNVDALAFSGDGAQLTNIDGSEVTGQVANSLVSGTVYEAAQPNITSVGTLTDLTVTGNVTAGFLYGDGSNITGLPAGYSNADVANYLPTYTGSMGNISSITASGDITANSYIGDGSQLTGLPAPYTDADVSFYLATGLNTANIETTGNINAGGDVAAAGNITTSGNVSATGFSGGGAALTSLTGANVTGTVANATFATTAGSVAGANVTGVVANAAFATVSASSNSVDGANVSGTVANATFATTSGSADSVAGANVIGQVANALVAGTVYEAAQPNITSVGTLSTLEVTGNVLFGNANIGNLVVTGTTTTANVSDLDIANATIVISSGANALVSNGAGLFIGSEVGTVGSLTYLNASDSWNSSLLFQAPDFTTPGNVTAAHLVGEAGNLSNITAANITGTVATATTAGTVTTAAQPNITSVGTLTGLTVSGVSNLSSVGNVIITGGTTGQALTTDGTGNLAWATVGSAGAPSNITNGTSNVNIATSGGTVTMAVAGEEVFELTGNSVSLGYQSGSMGSGTQGVDSVAIGMRAGQLDQFDGAIAIGNGAGQDTQLANSIAIGTGAGYNLQGSEAIAIGTAAGAGDPAAFPPIPRNAQGTQAIAIGSSAGVNYQGANSVAIGTQAGANRIGINSVAVGAFAGAGQQAANSIVINATGANLDALNSGLYAAPVRNDTGNTTNVVYYNTTTKEVTYGPGVAGYGNAEVVTLLSAFGSNSISTTGNIVAATIGNASTVLFGDGSNIAGLPAPYTDADVSLYLASGGDTAGYSTAGDIVANNIVASTGVSSLGDGLYVGNLSTQANLSVSGVTDLNSVGNVIITGGTAGQVLSTNGSGNLSWTTIATYGNSDVANYLASNANVVVTTTGNITTTANVSANNLSAIANIAAGNNITAVGNISANGNIVVNGTIGTGNISGANNISGLTLLASNAILVGSTVTTLPNTVARFGSNANSYTQITFQNLSTGTDATSDIVLTTDNGNDTVNFVDLGIINSAYDPNTPTNSLGNVVFASDAYLYAQGNVGNTSQSGGNLVLGATVANKSVKIFAGGNTNAFVTATFTSTAANLKALNVAGVSNLGPVGNVTITGGTNGQVLTTNGSGVLSWTTVSGGGGSYGDSNVTSLLAAYGSNTITTTGNVTVGNLELTGNITKGTGNSIQFNATNFVVGLNQASIVAVNPDEDTGYIALGTVVLGGGAQTIAIGPSAQSQAGGAGSISIGYKAAPFSPGAKSIAIGQFAGFGSFIGTKLGANAIAIGYGSANGGSAANVIILNATGANFTPSTSQASSFYVNPVRNDTANVANVVTYNQSTKEVTYANTLSLSGNITGGNIIAGNATDFVALRTPSAGTVLVNTTSGGIATGVMTVSQTGVSLGFNAAAAGIGTNAIAIGGGSASLSGGNTISIGVEAGTYTQGVNSVAIGHLAGQGVLLGAKLGANSVVIGAQAAAKGSANNVIILNATGANFTPSTSQASSFYVNPVRNDTGNVTNVMYYNTTTKEVTYGPGGGGGSTTIDRSVITGNVTLTLAQAGTFLYSTTATAQTVTIPTNATVAFPIGTSINVVLNGSGSVALTPDSGVSLYLAGNSTSATRTVSPYGLATLLQVDTDVWFVNGTGVY